MPFWKKNSKQHAEAIQPVKLGCPFDFNGKEKRYNYNGVWIYILDPGILSWPLLKIGVYMTVEAEPDNQYDPMAVAIKYQDRIVGYLYKKNHLYAMANDWLRKKLPMMAQMETIDKQENKASVILAFYDEPKFERLIRQYSDSKSYWLSRSSNAEAQEAIGFCSEGDEVNIEDDYDHGGYIITSSDTLGALPAAAVKLVDSYGGVGHCCAFIAEKEFTDSGKERVSVYIFQE